MAVDVYICKYEDPTCDLAFFLSPESLGADEAEMTWNTSDIVPLRSMWCVTDCLVAAEAGGGQGESHLYTGPNRDWERGEEVKEN